MTEREAVEHFVIDKWLAAPANPAEAIHAAIYQHLGEFQEQIEREYVDGLMWAMLDALGVPSEASS